MLNAFAERLRSLAETDYDQFKTEIKKRINGRFSDDQVATLKEFIFLMPATLKQFNLYWNKEDTPPDAKRVCGYIMTYISQTDNMLSADKLGLFGFLDDAYFVVQVYLQVHDHFLRDWHDLSHDELDLTERARRLVIAPQFIIPDETKRIDKMVNSLIDGHTVEFENFVAQAGK